MQGCGQVGPGATRKSTIKGTIPQWHLGPHKGRALRWVHKLIMAKTL